MKSGYYWVVMNGQVQVAEYDSEDDEWCGIGSDHPEDVEKVIKYIPFPKGY